MKLAESLLNRADRLQRDRAWLAVPLATWKKFGDDQAGNLAALIAYYSFVSTFPLLLVFITILDLVVRGNERLRQRLLNSALSRYPGVGAELERSVHGLGQTGLALVIGLLFTLYGALGVAAAMQNALNSVWAVPQFRRPHFPWSMLRSLGIIAVIGPGLIATITLSSLAGGTAHLGGIADRIAAAAVSLVLNIGLFWLGFRIATAAEIATRDLRLSAILSAFTWQVLQSIGGYFVGHQLANKSAYGVFGIVLGLLAWFYLQAQITLYVVELNVVRARQLWPRSLTPPPLSAADMRAYQLYAEASQRRQELGIQVRPAVPGLPGASGESPAAGASGTSGTSGTSGASGTKDAGPDAGQ
jgi:membrane protein